MNPTRSGDAPTPTETDEALARLVAGSCSSPFDVLGIHPLAPADGGGWVVRTMAPGHAAATVIRDGASVPMRRLHAAGLFEARFPDETASFTYRLRVEDASGRGTEIEDPYRFTPVLDDTRLQAFLEGWERRAHAFLGAHVMEHEGVAGVRFAVWAPNAAAVNVMGDHNGWEALRHPMRLVGASGVWELFIPGVGEGTLYKYRVVAQDGEWTDRADPYGRAMELRPASASAVWVDGRYDWSDDAWMAARVKWRPEQSPMSVYEVHPGSWRRRPPSERGEWDQGWLSYRQLADELLPYVRELGFTHVELLPVMEHPLDESWGYQSLGFFAPTSRFGSPDDFRYFVDRAHQLGIGVLLDWVPGHFPQDGHGLILFDGTPLYEHPDPLQAEHPDWGTLVFDYGRGGVQSFLISSAIHWLEDYHIDGLRVDAVASMLYLDYSRGEGEWTPNVHGGRENLEAVDLLRRLNDAVHQECPGALMAAEESTAWPGVSQGTDQGGLGFDQKWNMGWMNDTLSFMQVEPPERGQEYEKLTFSIHYAFSERFMLALSHDEVVHEKASLLSKMPGEPAAQFANLRLLFAYLWSHPGKKLLFMGGELAQWVEWRAHDQLDWALLEHATHTGVQRLVGELNRLYCAEPALHALDHGAEGFEWLDCHDTERVILSYVRWAPGWQDPVAVAINLTPADHGNFQLAVPSAGTYRVLLNTDGAEFGGEGRPVPETLETREQPLHGRDHVLELPLPGFTALYVRRVGP